MIKWIKDSSKVTTQLGVKYQGLRIICQNGRSFRCEVKHLPEPQEVQMASTQTFKSPMTENLQTPINSPIACEQPCLCVAEGFATAGLLVSANQCEAKLLL